MSDPVVQQFLLTRFNIRTPGVGYTEDQSPQWLEERIKLFAQYCVPSVAAQTQEEFDWLIFCDPSTAFEDLDRIRSFDRRIRIVLFAPQAGSPATRETAVSRTSKAPAPDGQAKFHASLASVGVESHLRPGVDVVISTRLDNDDALSRHALRRLRDLVGRFLQTGHDRWLYNPMFGYRFDVEHERLFAAAMPNSPFLSLFERVTEGHCPVGALSGHHSRMPERYPTYHDASARFWLQILHGGNVSNRIRPMDIEVPLESLGSDFSISL